jgi:hypothetical protein
LDSKTRNVIWNTLEAYPELKKTADTEFISLNKNINLPAGSYEVYYASAKRFFNDDVWKDGKVISWIKDFFGFDGDEFKEKYSEELFVTVSGTGSNFQTAEIEQLRKDFLSSAVVDFTKVADDKSLSEGFSLKADTKLKIYSVGEGREKEIFDYAWIYDEINNKIIWRMYWDNSSNAGGAEKNIRFNNSINLPAGTYTVHYVTDDSHSFQKWNSFPPFDPQFWGVAVFPASKSDLANIIPFKNEDAVKPLVEISKVGNDQIRSQGLRINKPTEVHILCLGESTNEKEYADYGWIINADTRETVWTMYGRNSENAGGASKNRMIDENINLQPGNYIVHYTTDDSHSFEEWNSGKPFNPSKWGITIWPTDNKSRSNAELFSAKDYRSKNSLAEIIHVKDNQHLQEKFELKKESKIRVFALGEGTGNEMVDYGWIENVETGKVVWDMSYRRTENAGGAEKNRSINEVITLPKGKYILHFKTDDSHSFGDWNADPPANHNEYGIILSYTEG